MSWATDWQGWLIDIAIVALVIIVWEVLGKDLWRRLRR